MPESQSSNAAEESENHPNERTSLFRRCSDPVLDNDGSEDYPPVIDPLNRRSARIYRAVLMLLFAMALFWLALLSVDQLISVGAGSTQGSGFETFTVTLLGLATIGASLLFYKAPSPSDGTLSLLCAFLLIIDMLIISMVEQLRRRIGILSLALSYGGATIAFLVSSQSDTIVQQAKEEEQQLVLGHSFTRRSISEWLGVVLSNSLRILIFTLIASMSINLIFDASDSHIRVGTLVPVGSVPDGHNDGTYIHLACAPAGTEGPVVIIEAGETSGEEMHGWVQQAQGIKAVCYWDRPGFGLSDNSPSPLGIDAVTSYLLAALEIERPEFHDEKIVLVSHGIGSLYSRVFANKVANQVLGLMLIDGLHEEQFYSEQTALYGLREFLRGISATVSLKKVAGVIRGMGAEDRLFGLLVSSQPRLHKAFLQQQVSANRRSAVDISLATGSLPADTPVMIVSSAEMCKDKQWNRYQRLLLKLTDRVVAWKILNGPHNLWWNKRAEKDLISQLESFVSYVKK